MGAKRAQRVANVPNRKGLSLVLHCQNVPKSRTMTTDEPRAFNAAPADDDFRRPAQGPGTVAVPVTPEPSTSAGRPREIGGRDGPEPTRFGDWEKAGRCIDF
jgi:hypothetical protein